MSNIIQIKGGTESALSSTNLEDRELYIATDTFKLFAGSGSNNDKFQVIGSSYYTHCHNYLISGTITNGSDNYINPFFVSLGNEQSATLKGYIGKLQSGSAVINIKRNDTNVVSNINISDTVYSGSCDISLSNYDMINIEVSSSISASNLSFGLVIENICQ